MQYNVFTDFHHAGLLNSLIMLFEKRLGGNVYRPIGREWAEKGFWKIYDHPATQAQYLNIGGATPDGTPKLNEVTATELTKLEEIPRIFHCKDIEGDTTNKAITFQGFSDLPIDIVIASIPAHVESFKKLCEIHPNKPRLIYQIGNAWTMEAGQAPNVMASALVPDVPANIHFISYHQEFDLNVFSQNSSGVMATPNTVRTFVNCFNTSFGFRGDWLQFLDIEQQMRDWDFKSFGGQCRDGSMNGTKALADKMREARFIWHVKAGGDGFGHVLYNSAAVGRPIITKKSYYANRMGEELMIDGQTCINIDNLSTAEIINKINYFNDPARYSQLCRAAYENFTKVCNFNQEFLLLTKFLQELQ